MRGLRTLVLASRDEPWSKGSQKDFKQGKNKSKFELQKKY